MPAVAKKAVQEMKLMGEERGLSLGMIQGRRQKKEGWQRNLNCQKICYNACVPETTMCEIRGGTKCIHLAKISIKSIWRQLTKMWRGGKES